jgi:hypothetical protein
MNYLKKLKIKKKIINTVDNKNGIDNGIDNIIDNGIENEKPFLFKYNSICPAISIILLEINKTKLFLWLHELCKLFNISMNTDKYIIDKTDLVDTISSNKWFNRIFDNNVWDKAKISANNPSLWGKYIWALIYIIGLFWTEKSKNHIAYLLKHIGDILPCLKCRTHFNHLLIKYENRINNLINLNSCINLIINLYEDINNSKNENKLKINKLNYISPYEKYTFVELYNYLTPLVEPDNVDKNNIISKCSCGKKHI